MNIYLPGVKTVEKFHSIVSESNCDINVRPVNYKCFIDAKSIMGIFSLDLSSPIHLEIIGGKAEKDKLIRELKQFEVRE